MIGNRIVFIKRRKEYPTDKRTILINSSCLVKLTASGLKQYRYLHKTEYINHESGWYGGDVALLSSFLRGCTPFWRGKSTLLTMYVDRG